LKLPVIDLLVAAKICETKSEARRLIEQGGLTIDEQKITDLKESLPATKFADGSSALIRKGKKNFYKLILR
jgi:tyrosyl-tRNA synthetase